MTENQRFTSPDPLEIRLSQAWPTGPWQPSTVLVALSGGPDSLALLHGLLALQPDRGRIVAAHFHHQLRGAAADGDQHFVQQTCQTLGVDCVTGSAAPTELCQKRPGIGLEAAARQLRYRFLIETAEQRGARFVTTGHTADDQAETVLHHILRGTGLAGLSGIQAVRAASEAVTIIRPLLAFSRDEILAYLARREQPFRTDTTNQDRRFTRNRLRRDLLPQIEEQFNPQVRDALLRLSRIARETQESLLTCLTPLLEQHVETDRTVNAQVMEVLCDPSLQRLTPHLQRELFAVLWRQQRWPLRRMGFRHWQQLAAMLNDPDAAPITLPYRIRAERQPRRIRLTRPAPPCELTNP